MIDWVKKPRFEVVENRGQWNEFECIEGGLVFWTNGGDVKTTFEIEIKKGWITDFTSSPSWARSFVSQLGPHAPAVLLHDWAIDHGFNRKAARRLLKEQLLLLEGVSRFKAYLIVFGVWTYDSTLGRFKK